jgi:chaperonin GroES
MEVFRPSGQRVLIKMDSIEGRSKGGIVIPDKYRPEALGGHVHCVGLGETDKTGNKVPFEVKKGDRVMLGMHSGFEIVLAGAPFRLVDEADILLVLPDESL